MYIIHYGHTQPSLISYPPPQNLLCQEVPPHYYAFLILVFFYDPLNFNQGCVYDHECRAIQWSMDDSLVVPALKI